MGGPFGKLTSLDPGLIKTVCVNMGGQLFVIVATPLLDPQDRLELMGPVRAVSARPG